MSVKISELTASSAVTSNDFIPIVDYETATTKRASANQILDYVTGSTFNNLTVNNLSGTTAQFTVVSASVISASSYIGPISGGTGLIGETTRTINLSSSMTVPQIQSEIDNIKKYIPSGETVTVQFADGTYTITGTLNFKGFFGGGELKIVGNLTETTASHSNQAVILDATSTQDFDLLKIENCRLNTTVDRIQFKINSGSIASSCVRGIKSDFINVEASYFSGSAGPAWPPYPATYGIRMDASRAKLSENTCTGLEHFISVYETSNILSYNNTTTGNLPYISLNSISAVIYRSGTQPSGVGSSGNVGDGGQIL